MAFDPKTVFNKVIPATVKGELDRRAKFAAGIKRNDSFRKWNYKKYAYVSITATGKNALEVVCSSAMTIGDGTLNKEAGLDLYETEGGIRRSIPILTSVTLDSDGSTDATTATMWTAKAEFNVYTLSQLNKAEKSFLRIGSEVELNYGWRGEGAGPNSGGLKGSVTNFNFSANKDGSFACSFEFIGANGDFSGEAITGSPAGDAEKTQASKDSKPIPFPNIVRTIELQHEIAFAIPVGETYSDDTVEEGKIVVKGEFALVNFDDGESGIVEYAYQSMGFTEESMTAYVTLNHFINQLNIILNKGAKGKTIVCNADVSIGAYIPTMFSADPFNILFGGEMANYGAGLLPVVKPMLFGSELTEFQSSNGADLSKIFISTDFLGKVYDAFKNSKSSDTDNSQQPPAVKDMLNAIFSKIEQVSGGLYQLKVYLEAFDDPKNVYIINKRKGYNAGASDGTYEFKVIGETSIIRDMSLSTEFNAEMVAAANIGARSGGSSTELPSDMFGNLYQDCDKIPIENVVTEAELTTLRDEYVGSPSPKLITDAGDALREYLLQNKDLTNGEFSSVPYFINLSVTLDGIDGIPYFGRFRVDRLPATYAQNIYFAVMKVNHSFDGQGDWSTQIEGVMQVKE
tara:strand:- start:302 stop:2185 length:1884 start_codon:yes stop_codon:yes gene_type:complete